MVTDPLETLATRLADAQAAATRVAGRAPAGLRPVEPADGHRWYLCAFDGPAFLCLDERLVPETERGQVHRAASCALLVEHAESLVDGPELAMLATLAGRTGCLLDGSELPDTLQALAVAADALRGWRDAPERVVASVADLDVGVGLHNTLRAAYERYLERSEPLVAAQDRLGGDVVEALRELELTAGRLAVGGPLAAALAEAIGAIDAGADEIAAQHVTPLGAGADSGR